MKIELDDKTTISIVDNTENEHGELFSEDGEVLIVKLDKALKPVLKFAEQALNEVTASIKPSELELSFGAEAGGEGGVFGLAKAHAKATISIKMKWIP